VLVPFHPAARVHLGVVALGTPARLVDCLEALRTHRSRHEFVVSVCVNRDTMTERPLAIDVPQGMHVERPQANLGWGAGLQRLRPLVAAEYFVWVQDDMLPEPGWLDALVDAADAHPRVGMLGALRVDDAGDVMLHNGGLAQPPDRVDGWNETDTTVEHTPTEVTVLEWVTSKGCLVRTAAFDDVHGPDPRLWPLNHVDKDFSTHLRCHGWDVALVPEARLRHAQSQASPLSFRTFLTVWRDGWFDRRWAAPVMALAGRTSGPVEHRCAEWRHETVDRVEAVSGREATAMLVPFARMQAEHVEGLLGTVEGLTGTVERLTAAVADLEHRLAASRRRSRRLRRRLAALQAQQARRGRRRLLRAWRS
jgi:GT2 family glycosyltransferase